MGIELKVRTAVTALVVVMLAISAGSITMAELGVGPTEPEPDEATVTLEDESELWPYTSRGPNFEERTLSINLIIYGDINVTQHVLTREAFAGWEELDEERDDIAPLEDPEFDRNETTMAWGGAAGANRWVWVDPPNSDAVWLGEAYQLEDGDYLGARHHIRAYEDPEGGSWTALQAHGEHWDWFHLRHSVHTIEESQLYVEDDFRDRWFVESLIREYLGNDDSSDADGWATVIHLEDELLPALLGMVSLVFFAGVGSVRTWNVRARLLDSPALLTGARVLGVVLGLLITYHAVRFGAIGIERAFPAVNPKIFVAIGYPILVLGLPIVAYLTARPLDRKMAFASATIGFIIMIFIDYTYLQVFQIPLETFIHRGSLAVAIGLIATGASYESRTPGVPHGYVRSGVLLWFAAVAMPLLQFI